MKPGTQVTKNAIIPLPRLRYETFEHNNTTAPLTYKKQGKVLWVFWTAREAIVRWSDGTRSTERFENLEEI